jgi:hypothetical protein
VKILSAVLVAVLGSIGFTVWYEAKHPCVRYEDRARTCGGRTYCAFFDPQGVCVTWFYEPVYECVERVCAERR